MNKNVSIYAIGEKKFILELFVLSDDRADMSKCQVSFFIYLRGEIYQSVFMQRKRAHIFIKSPASLGCCSYLL